MSEGAAPSLLTVIRGASVEGGIAGLAATVASVILDAIQWPLQPHLWTAVDAMGFVALGVGYAAVRRGSTHLPPFPRVVKAIFAGVAIGVVLGPILIGAKSQGTLGDLLAAAGSLELFREVLRRLASIPGRSYPTFFAGTVVTAFASLAFFSEVVAPWSEKGARPLFVLAGGVGAGAGGAIWLIELAPSANNGPVVFGLFVIAIAFALGLCVGERVGDRVADADATPPPTPPPPPSPPAAA